MEKLVRIFLMSSVLAMVMSVVHLIGNTAKYIVFQAYEPIRIEVPVYIEMPAEWQNASSTEALPAEASQL